jgi:hypothetical protein
LFPKAESKASNATMRQPRSDAHAVQTFLSEGACRAVPIAGCKCGPAKVAVLRAVPLTSEQRY